MNYYFNPDARADHLEHIRYYESQQKDLGTRYLATFTSTMVKICSSWQQYKIEFPPNIRICKICAFPYNIFYRQIESDIEILVIAPHRRRPNYWLDRI